MSYLNYGPALLTQFTVYCIVLEKETIFCFTLYSTVQCAMLVDMANSLNIFLKIRFFSPITFHNRIHSWSCSLRSRKRERDESSSVQRQSKPRLDSAQQRQQGITASRWETRDDRRGVATANKQTFSGRGGRKHYPPRERNHSAQKIQPS